LKFTPTNLPEVLLIEPRVSRDERGFFVENYRKDLFASKGVRVDFVQDNHTLSKKGALRGLHFQIAPKEQAKLVRVVRGEVFDVAVDLRKGSKTFGQHASQLLSGENQKMLFVPAGFAHGYLTLSDEAEFLYKVSDYYSPEHERGLLWNDPALGIRWPKTGAPYLLSEKDKKASLLKDLK
jgi:dTDP-4-dehydrorhamnose 3,5-epimerase